MKRCNKTFKVVALALLLACLCTVSVTQAAVEGGNANRGKAVAKEKCKGCHIAGAEGGTMTPLSKTQKQWQRFYKKDKHNTLAPGAWDKITPSELIDVMQFMHDHAADSPQPATCGQ